MRFLQGLLKVLFYVAIGAVLSIVGAAVFFMTWEPDRELYPVRGIDVSRHQGAIDWHQVAADDVAFAYMKASEGGDFKDKAFSANWKNAGDAGLVRGAYHFFSLCKSGAEQAANFLQELPVQDAMLPPVIDIEFEGNCARRPTRDELLREVSDFVTQVEQASGREVMLYAPEDVYFAYLTGQGLSRPLWARSIWRSPGYANEWAMWQYHQRGDIAGIEGEVDLNVLASGLTLDSLVR
ncbi:GH25 family lysozyme [Roseibium sp.]|uniref:glycoside hydrolase family 25 protein n=2 Tax=Roseibium sp. TaxID=1936156 RepID=UPI003262CF82